MEPLQNNRKESVPLSKSALRALSAPVQSQPTDYILRRFLTVNPVEDPLVVYARLAIRAGSVVSGVESGPNGTKVPGMEKDKKS
ncbi:hypothetical protein BDD12DRAFT_873109 [Trichophaea hybrida]|nr:hypothetical protein BDD12DRAFT_873109 [Trichophaea hybrida]